MCILNRKNNNTIMVVDDDRDILQITTMALEGSGHNIHGFTDPLKAIQHAEDGCIECEVLVSDIKMPHMIGFQLARRIKELRPEIKIIMMTAFEVNLREFESVFPSLPVDRVLHKPFAPSVLVETVKAVRQKPAKRA